MTGAFGKLVRPIVAGLVLSGTAGCAHFGLDSEADIAAENCYAFRYGDKLRRVNFAKAYDWCHRSARYGDANSQALLGELFYSGLGGPVDMRMAAQWFDTAARQGHAHAQYMLYRIYSVSAKPSLREKALYWLEQARRSGYKLALQAP